MKRGLLLICCLFLILNISYAADEVNVKIPSFKTTINEFVFDNEKELYPLVVYKDITYFPMTYSLCQNVGLVISWDRIDGLYIANYAGNNEEYKSYAGSNKKDTIYKATIARYPIIINGLQIDNDEEEFPVLNFRDITYFPLTWRFANDEYGWQISYSKEKGLVVDTRDRTSPMYLTKINKNNAELQVCKDIYDKTVNEDGDIESTLTGRKYYNYSLDYSSNSLILVDESETSDYKGEEKIAEDVTDNFELEDGYVYYNDKKVENLGQFEGENVRLSGEIWEFDDKNIISLTVYLDDHIPAPYTPYENYVLVETKDIVKNVVDWDKAQMLTNVYKSSVGYYLCSNHRNLGGKFSNSAGMIAILDKEGNLEIINKRYNDYNSLRVVGYFDDGLYVLATYFPDKDKIMAVGKVSAINDGYFYMSSNGEMTKIYDFIDGDAFVTKEGSLYCIRNGVYEVVNLTTGKRARL
ncbi:MAG: hypothetical protein IJS47_00840 [Clostridia bacterium]|nr:hypothetical protein [Clostridia bacterium]